MEQLLASQLEDKVAVRRELLYRTVLGHRPLALDNPRLRNLAAQELRGGHTA
jgi:hypothetical protein